MGINWLVNKHAGQRGEMFGILGGVIAAGATLAAMTLNLGMASQVVGKAFCHNGTLLDDVHAVGFVLVVLILSISNG